METVKEFLRNQILESCSLTTCFSLIALAWSIVCLIIIL